MPFDVCVTVQDEDSSVQDCIQVTIRDLEPTPHFEGPNNGLPRRGADVRCLSYGEWRSGRPALSTGLGLGRWQQLEIVELRDGQPNQFVRSHSFTRDGVFTVRLRAVDEDSAAIFERVVVRMPPRRRGHAQCFQVQIARLRKA